MAEDHKPIIPFHCTCDVHGTVHTPHGLIDKEDLYPSKPRARHCACEGPCERHCGRILPQKTAAELAGQLVAEIMSLEAMDRCGHGCH